MNIEPVEMSKEAEDRARWFIDLGDWKRAFAAIVQIDGWARGEPAPAPGENGEGDVVRAEQERISALLKGKAGAIEFEREADGDIKKTAANKARQIIVDTLNGLADEIMA